MESARAAGRAALRSRALTAAEDHLRTALQLSLSAAPSSTAEAVICMNDLAGALLERRLQLVARSEGCLALDVAEVEQLAQSCLASLQTLGYKGDHSAIQSAQRNLDVVRGYKAAAEAEAAASATVTSGAAPTTQTSGAAAAPAPAPPDDAAAAAAAAAASASQALLHALSGEWLIDESISQNTGALLKYFGAPWLLVQAVLASPTPPMHVALGSDLVTLRITYPGLFPLVNTYTAGAPSFHRTPFGGQQPATFRLGSDEAGPGGPALVLDIPQSQALGLMRITHALRGDGRHWVIVRMLVGSSLEEKLRITRVYDRVATKRG